VRGRKERDRRCVFVLVSATKYGPAGHRSQRSRRGEDQRKARTGRPRLHHTDDSTEDMCHQSGGVARHTRPEKHAPSVRPTHTHLTRRAAPTSTARPRATPGHTGRTRRTSDARRTLRRTSRMKLRGGIVVEVESTKSAQRYSRKTGRSENGEKRAMVTAAPLQTAKYGSNSSLCVAAQRAHCARRTPLPENCL
jgi:hypothetical protein